MNELMLYVMNIHNNISGNMALISNAILMILPVTFLNGFLGSEGRIVLKLTTE